ncbi:ParM/StbA family protein [Clostridium botulinum]|uniref:ParM/StbA family protein n=1 Tax=Clostridium botulinum TaxID=1491 RepID=UPI0013F0E947|nr:ParM/StbA family protein [Clostridium botulinum]MCS6110730.1 exopolyphosphatase [Clostridium botulinum]NFE11260.1 ParM/StbA family protein [Clostridium botulinum]NFO40086.1 ParM/StbA family protein [Clostridium botulinum]
MENKTLNINNKIIENGANENKVCVVDLGNYNVKAINNKRKQISFQSNLSRDYETFPDGFKYVLLDGEYTFFEKGNFNLEYIKTQKNYTSQLLYAISLLHEDEEIIETNLVLLLPISEMQEKQKYINDLKDKEFEFTVRTNKKKDKIIKINDVFVTPEGYSSYFTLNDNVKDSNLLLIDVGGRSSDVIALEHGKPQVLKTYHIGILDLYMKLQNINADKEYKLEEIRGAIDRGYIKVTKKQLASFTQDIINEIKIDVNLSHFDNVVWTGGASKVIEEIINDILPKQCYLHENPLYSNIFGALEVGKIAFNKVGA